MTLKSTSSLYMELWASYPLLSTRNVRQSNINPGDVTFMLDSERLTAEDLDKIYDELSVSQNSGLSSQCDVQVIITENKDNDIDTVQYHKPAYVAVGLIMAMTGISVFFPMIIAALGTNSIYAPRPLLSCAEQCRVTLVESIPENLTYPHGSPEHESTFDGWQRLIDAANHSIDIASFYWTLRGSDIKYEDPSAKQGETIFEKLRSAGKNNIQIRIAQNIPTEEQPNYDTAQLISEGLAEVRSLNFSQWFGGGVLHTKMWIVDKKHFYIGSANMDWRSLTQVKELGVIIDNCSCLVQDVQKLFDVYWFLGKPNISLPAHWPASWATKFNNVTPAEIRLSDKLAQVYLSSSPAAFCPEGRLPDLDAILNVINKAETFVHIAVMDYYPLQIYTHPNRFWPVIDDALRRVALEKKIQVRLLASLWPDSRPDLHNYLLSLSQLNYAMKADIEVKLFHVPSTKAQKQIPFARVNHNKYMVTDNTAYIGTSNWSGDYFIQTGGVGIIINQSNSTFDNNSTLSVQQQLEAVFDRDWYSPCSLHVNETLHMYQLHQNTQKYYEYRS